MFSKVIVGLTLASLVAAQSLPSLPAGTCSGPCSGLTGVSRCQNSEDLSCVCGVYESALPGACIDCWNGVDSAIGQDLTALVNYCKSGTFSGVPAATNGPTGTGSGSSGATATAGGSSASSTSSAQATGSAHSSGSTTVVATGLMWVMLAVGAIIGA